MHVIMFSCKRALLSSLSSICFEEEQSEVLKPLNQKENSTQTNITLLIQILLMCTHTYSFIFILGFAEHFQDINGSIFTTTVSPAGAPSVMCNLLGSLSFLFYHPTNGKKKKKEVGFQRNFIWN